MLVSAPSKSILTVSPFPYGTLSSARGSGLDCWFVNSLCIETQINDDILCL